MRDLPIIIASGSSVDVSVGMDDAMVVEVVTAVGDIGIIIDGGAGATVTRPQGEAFTATGPFKKLRLTSATDQTVVVSIGRADEWVETTKRTIVNAADSPVITKTLVGWGFSGGYQDVAAGAAESIGVFNIYTTRRIWVSLGPTAIGPVRIQEGLSTNADASGIWLYPGQPPTPIQGVARDTLTSGQLYAFNPNAGIVVVTVGIETL